jgi:alpha-glucosidase
MAWALLTLSTTLVAKSFNLSSPNGQLKAVVNVDKQITYQLSYSGTPLLQPSPLTVNVVGGKTWGEGSHLKKASTTTINQSIPTVAYKKAVVRNHCNQLSLTFREGFSLLFRAYNDGFAYRFVSNQKKGVTVKDEPVKMNFAKDWQTVTPYVRSAGTFEEQVNNSFENTYTQAKLSQLDPKHLAFLPIIVKADNGLRLAITEADLEDFPGLFLTGGQSTTLSGYHARYPDKVEQGGHNQLEEVVKSTKDYIAQFSGPHALPWRVVSVATTDEQLLGDDMVYRLASPNRIGDTSWIKPGKVAWDWWNDWGVYKVDFKAGINTQTYKYYIDFAAKHGIEYVILDEGWAVNLKADLFQVIPEIDLKEIVDYGKQKGVGIILWAGYYAVDRDLEHVCKYFSEMGVKGFKVDFMNRDDALCVNFHYRVAAMAAKYHLLVDFHGTYKPTGLNRTYPNVINFEGVDGQEQNKWSTMKEYDQVVYDCTVPFARMLAGQMDYTQGAMLNGTRDSYHPSNTMPMSQGTRAHQLAEYVVFFSPLNMLCDSPTHYDENPECTEFIASIPTTWDETIPLKSEIGEYVAVARRHGSKWYVGAITNWTPRDLTLDLSPLKVQGRTATMYADGLNAEKMAQDYQKSQVTIPADGHLQVHLAPGGGVALSI